MNGLNLLYARIYDLVHIIVNNNSSIAICTDIVENLFKTNKALPFNCRFREVYPSAIKKIRNQWHKVSVGVLINKNDY